MKLLVVLLSLVIHGVVCMNYNDALSKTLLYFEAQRSGKLPAHHQRVAWRGDSALKDGQDAGVDLVGGYYDAGDNVKFGLPMAYTITLLAWGVVEFRSQLGAHNELQNALGAIKWGSDYFLKAHTSPNILYAGVGDGDSDHQCWQRPEDMTTPRTAYKIDEHSPGSDLAAETAAALAAASIAFSNVDRNYSSFLLTHAKQLFDFAKNHQGKYSDSIPSAGKFYSSSGFQDELLWAAAWLHRATREKGYLNFLGNFQANGGTRPSFCWDDKFVGAQILVAKQVLEGKVPNSGKWEEFKGEAEQFICNCVQKGNNNIPKTNGGLLWFNDWNNLQYVTSASLAITVYADYLSTTRKSLKCPSSVVNSSDLIAFVKSQVNYILGANPKSTSYMVGFGSKYPQQVHHRGASIVSIKKDPKPVGCQDGFNNWFYKNQPNPNVLAGAIVGGPDKNDNYVDQRSNYQSTEPALANSAGLVGVLARIS